MTEQDKQLYKEQMRAKALAYAENVLSDVKPFLPKDEYQESVRDFGQAFIAGVDASITWLKEYSEKLEKEKV